MKQLLSCEFNMDTVCVELKFADGSMISIDTLAGLHPPERRGLDGGLDKCSNECLERLDMYQTGLNHLLRRKCFPLGSDHSPFQKANLAKPCMPRSGEAWAEGLPRKSQAVLCSEETGHQRPLFRCGKHPTPLQLYRQDKSRKTSGEAVDWSATDSL